MQLKFIWLQSIFELRISNFEHKQQFSPTLRHFFEDVWPSPTLPHKVRWPVQFVGCSKFPSTNFYIFRFERNSIFEYFISNKPTKLLIVFHVQFHQIRKRFPTLLKWAEQLLFTLYLLPSNSHTLTRNVSIKCTHCSALVLKRKKHMIDFQYGWRTMFMYTLHLMLRLNALSWNALTRGWQTPQG